ncbi:MAG: amino acid-binding protein [Proteobacteria bacterium]|nr:amino acid-binding protein [Pseudomonadota bacterium]
MDRRGFLNGAMLAAMLWPLGVRQVGAQEPTGRRRLVVGQTVDLSGVMQNIGRDYFTGAKLAFDQANQGGGAGGRLIQFVQMDDGGDPAGAVANAGKLIESVGADVLFGLSSEACVEAVSQCAAFRHSDVEIFAPLSGVDHPGAKGRVVYLRPSSADEMKLVLKRLTFMSLTRLAILHTETPSMIATRDAALGGLAELNIERPRSYVLKDGASNARSLIEAIARDRIQAVVIMSDAFSAGLLLQQLRVQNPALFVCLGSMVDVSTVYQILGQSLSNGVMVSRAVPDPSNTLIPVVANFKRILARYMDEAPSSAGLEGFIAAQTLLAVLRKTDNPRQLASAARNRVGALDLGGWTVNLANNRASGRIEISMLTRDGRLI